MKRIIERWRYLPIQIVAAVLLTVSSAHACNVPVFRYALERWQPDAYEVILFHEGASLSPDLEKLAAELRQTDDRGRPLANLRLTTIDIQREMDEATRALWNGQDGATTPWLVVRYPAALQLDTTVWSGPANTAAVTRLVQSPARDQLGERLLSGQSVVWIVIESGDAERDQNVVDKLQHELRALEKTVKLPDETAQPGGVLRLPEDQGEGVLSKIPLKIQFSILRVARSDVAEQALLDTILQTDPGLAAESGAIVIPVFGRGRALQAFPGLDLDAGTIAGATEFLCGACSCSVKSQNPGMDLLLSANWEDVLAIETQDEKANTTTVAANVPPETLVPIPPGQEITAVEDAAADASPAASGQGRVGHGAIVALALVGVIAMLAVFAVRRRRPNSQ